MRRSDEEMTEVHTSKNSGTAEETTIRMNKSNKAVNKSEVKNNNLSTVFSNHFTSYYSKISCSSICSSNH